MPSSPSAKIILPLAFAAVLGACASPDPVPYRDIPSASYLQPSSGDRRVPYRYQTGVDWRQYSKAIVEPVQIYQGVDGQLGDISPEDRMALALYMHDQFSIQLARRFQLTNNPGHGTLRIKLTLTGAATTTPVLGPLSRFDIAGGLYNGVQSVRGGEGTLTGSVTYVVDIYDALNNRLLHSQITKQYPNSMNVGAAFGSLSAARTGIEKGAQALMEQLS